MGNTPNADRIHIGFFGRRNAGKSSVVNAITGQELSVVSDVKGTTTDPVKKAMELLPLGPVLIIDTPGFDDEGELGELRIKKAKQVLNMTDIAVLVIDAVVGVVSIDMQLISLFKEKAIPYLVVYNKSDLISVEKLKTLAKEDASILISAKNNHNIQQLKEKIGLLLSDKKENNLIDGLANSGDVVVLVTPIDSAAPKGRMIMPQQMTIRALVEANSICVVVQESELLQVFEQINNVKLVISDSQALKKIKEIVPSEIAVTTFSILMARYKGVLDNSINGAMAISQLDDGDKILISEGCTHHRQCDDIGSVKIPKWLNEYTKKKLEYEFSSGFSFPEDLTKYKLVIHCGGCMLNEKEVGYRRKCAEDSGVPFTNYGIVIALVNGMLARCLKPFGM